MGDCMGGGEKSASTGEAAPRVLLVDDDDALRRASARVLGNAGFDVVQAADGREAIGQLERGEFDVVVSDVMMPNMTGLELLRAIRQRDLELPVILLTGMPNVEAALEAGRHGALHYLAKPVNNSQLVAAVARAERLRRLA